MNNVNEAQDANDEYNYDLPESSPNAETVSASSFSAMMISLSLNLESSKWAGL